jgi:hypothetical protein
MRRTYRTCEGVVMAYGGTHRTFEGLVMVCEGTHETFEGAGAHVKELTRPAKEALIACRQHVTSC